MRSGAAGNPVETCAVGAEHFASRAALVAAEAARIEGRIIDAEHLYDRAIQAASSAGCVHHEAFANELAGRFYAARGLEKIALAYLRDARSGYQGLGADERVQQLDADHPRLVAAPASARAPLSPDHAEQLELATVIQVAGAVGGETVLEKLLDTLMRTALEQARAERGVLHLTRALDQETYVEATTSEDKVVVRLLEPTARPAMPEAILRLVAQTREAVVLEDASADGQFAGDPYVDQHRPRSVLCLPLVYQTKLLGVLYLETRQASRVFSPLRLAVLRVLVSQAAIALENSHLYRDLATREVQIRRLVDANILGVFVYRLRGDITDANDAFLEMMGYSRDDLRSGSINWAELTPGEWAPQDLLAFQELNATGVVRAYEKEYFRKDGTRIPILIGGAMFGGTDTGVCMVVDIGEQKRAQEALQRRDAELAQVQAELAHVSRVTTLGELAASIAHEVSQPVAGILHNATAGLRWLSREPPSFHEVEQTLSRIVRDAQRASDVVDRIRRLSKKSAFTKERVNINEAVVEVLALTRGEAQRKSVVTRMQLSSEVSVVQADRVQVQQVVLNLVLNAIEAMAPVSGRRELFVCSEACSDLAQRWPEAGSDNAAPAQRHLVVAFRDTGPGLDPQQSQSAFAPFYSTKTGGLGMGLAISRSIIEAHGGRLWAARETQAGAEFRFALPMDDEDVQ
jgi:PAS domain S-box-containing protein